MLTRQRSSSRKYVRFAANQKSFARRPIDPSSIPKQVHEATVTTTIRASDGSASSPGRKPRSSAPMLNVNAETSNPFASTGTRRPRRTAARVAYEAITIDATPSAATSASGPQTPPPTAAWRSASTPQYGGSAHEIGRVQTGNSDVEKTRPDAIQTGYSSRFAIAFA